jgi:hypothetical protein
VRSKSVSVFEPRKFPLGVAGWNVASPARRIPFAPAVRPAREPLPHRAVRSNGAAAEGSGGERRPRQSGQRSRSVRRHRNAPRGVGASDLAAHEHRVPIDVQEGVSIWLSLCIRYCCREFGESQRFLRCIQHIALTYFETEFKNSSLLELAANSVALILVARNERTASTTGAQSAARAKIVFELPRTGTNKIDRIKLRAMARGGNADSNE